MAKTAKAYANRPYRYSSSDRDGLNRRRVAPTLRGRCTGNGRRRRWFRGRLWWPFFAPRRGEHADASHSDTGLLLLGYQHVADICLLGRAPRQLYIWRRPRRPRGAADAPFRCSTGVAGRSCGTSAGTAGAGRFGSCGSAHTTGRASGPSPKLISGLISRCGVLDTAMIRRRAAARQICCAISIITLEQRSRIRHFVIPWRG